MVGVPTTQRRKVPQTGCFYVRGPAEECRSCQANNYATNTKSQTAYNMVGVPTTQQRKVPQTGCLYVRCLAEECRSCQANKYAKNTKSKTNPEWLQFQPPSRGMLLKLVALSEGRAEECRACQASIGSNTTRSIFFKSENKPQHVEISKCLYMSIVTTSQGLISGETREGGS